MLMLKNFFTLNYLMKVSTYVLLFATLFWACNNGTGDKASVKDSVEHIKAGNVLAARYCGSCHLLPDPAWLNKKSWSESVIPAMGPRLGIFRYNSKEYPSMKNDPYVAANFYPAKPMLDSSQWQNIIDYYSAASPDTLVRSQTVSINKTLSLFSAQLPHYVYTNAATSFIKINPAGVASALIISDVFKSKTYLFDKNLSVTDSFFNKGAVVNMDAGKRGTMVCDIGILNPNNGKFGKGIFISRGRNGKYKEDSLAYLDTLQRPVQISSADFNGDGQTDYLICEFGYVTGALSWLEGKSGGGFTRHVIRPLPGAIKAYVDDYNHDGAPDIWVMFAQGDEGIFLYTNNRNGSFTEERILSFPSVYGSSFFELVDFDGDGYKDIVYTCGDNADYSPILKPYHGVYLFMNDKKNHFSQKFFFPINGCYKALARDYDGDGDLDIAAISFFADYKNTPEEGFVYLKNEGGFRFQAYSLPASTAGRWLTMDAGDLDGDGDIDLVLGNFCVGPTIIKSKNDWSKSPPFIYLINNSNKKGRR